LKNRASLTSSKIKETVKEEVTYIDDDEQISTKFLFNLKDDEPKLLMDKMISHDKCVAYINHNHVSKCISMNDLGKKTSSDHRNGKFLLSQYCNNIIILFRKLF
jgi:hypothetical protein